MPRSYFKTTFSVTLSEAKGLKYLKKTRLFASHRMTIFFWFPSSCFAQKPAVLMQAGFRQAELGAKVRSQAGAWEREEKRKTENGG